MKKRFVPLLILSLTFLWGCQKLTESKSYEGSSEDSLVQNREAEQAPLQDKETNPEVPNLHVPPQPADAVRTDDAQMKEQALPSPSTEASSENRNSYVESPSEDVHQNQDDNNSKGAQFNNPDELKQFIAEHQAEAAKKSDLQPKKIKCHVHTDGVNSKFFEFTNEYETKFSEKGFKDSYCDEKTMKYYGSSEFDFECYEVKKDNETRVKNGFEVKHHISCASKNVNDSTDMQIVNPFYDPNSKNKKAEEFNEEAELKQLQEIAEEETELIKKEAEALQKQIDELDIAKQQAEAENKRRKAEREEIDTKIQKLLDAESQFLSDDQEHRLVR